MEDNIQIGDPEFGKMMFVLDQEITDKNHRDYRYENEELIQIADGVWAMPAYMKDGDDFSLFFIITKIDDGNTVVAFATGENNDGNFSLSQPIITGNGINLMNEHNETRAKSILHFLNQISKADEGNWRMVE
ncbi:hypothetical protein [Lentilactobacillus sp. Marseille-Q4993]|uniref:hypothetical protein n=1 Tax=Lentilactobacillus sp. Marseille-Q4993 TaxID=3039492 RepID=UPI0024BD3AFB|nr:hypothetical protein [Lentilactobacillus sp. Marseille-Q4993]